MYVCITLLLLCSRMQSLRRSIRDSFRQRRGTAVTQDRKRIAESLNADAGFPSSRKKQGDKGRARASSEPNSPVMNAASPTTEMASQVTCLVVVYMYTYLY